jgi:hypothetical protein
MTATVSSPAALAVIEPAFTEPERLALAGFLAGYSGLTCEAYALDLRLFTVPPATAAPVHRPPRRHRVVRPRPRSRWKSPRDRHPQASIAGLYKYAVEEDLLDHSGAAHVRRPRIDYESHTTGLDRNEVGALLVAAGLGTAAEHALVSLLALNGLPVSEATGSDIEALVPSEGAGPWRSPARAAREPSSRSRRGPHGRSTWPSANAARDRSSPPPPASGSTGTEQGGSSAGSPDAPGGPGLVLAEQPGFMIGAVGHAEQVFCVPMSAYLAACFRRQSVPFPMVAVDNLSPTSRSVLCCLSRSAGCTGSLQRSALGPAIAQDHGQLNLRTDPEARTRPSRSAAMAGRGTLLVGSDAHPCHDGLARNDGA